MSFDTLGFRPLFMANEEQISKIRQVYRTTCSERGLQHLSSTQVQVQVQVQIFILPFCTYNKMSYNFCIVIYAYMAEYLKKYIFHGYSYLTL